MTHPLVLSSTSSKNWHSEGEGQLFRLGSNNQTAGVSFLPQLAHRFLGDFWCADITFVGPPEGSLLVAIMDWVQPLPAGLGSLSVCVSVLERALAHGRRPEIHNTDQGGQFTSADWLSVFKDWGIRISMDGRGRAFDNIMIQRLWRTVRWDHVFLREHRFIASLCGGLDGSHNKHRWPGQTHLKN